MVSVENWHQEFNPSKFLQRVQLTDLLAKSVVDGQSRLNSGSKECLLCRKAKAAGVLLNDGGFLCESCFTEIASTVYPEKYERLRREFLVRKEAHRIAHDTMVSSYTWQPRAGVFWLIGFVSFGLLFFHEQMWIITAAIFAAAFSLKLQDDRKLRESLARQEDWRRVNPEPTEPVLKHFHDDNAELTPRDVTIMKIFEHWPGYPPFWSYLRAVVLSRDAHRCQVTGCPSRLELHVHHIRPTFAGGPHSPKNLVTLCQFHHAIQPERGHERIWGTVKGRFFTLVHKHQRSNRSGNGTHMVAAHLRRQELITLEELTALHQYYGFLCKTCYSAKLRFELSKKQKFVRVTCTSCGSAMQGPQQLTEETGPRIAENHCVQRNRGSWTPNWEVLSNRKDSMWNSINAQQD